MIRLLPYYAIPVLCAGIGGAIGYFGARSSRLIASIVSLIVLVFVSGLLEVTWHEAYRLESVGRLRVIFATALALAVPTLGSFLPAWFARRGGMVPRVVVVRSALVSLPVVAVYPIGGYCNSARCSQRQPALREPQARQTSRAGWRG